MLMLISIASFVISLITILLLLNNIQPIILSDIDTELLVVDVSDIKINRVPGRRNEGLATIEFTINGQQRTVQVPATDVYTKISEDLYEEIKNTSIIHNIKTDEVISLQQAERPIELTVLGILLIGIIGVPIICLSFVSNNKNIRACEDPWSNFDN